MSRSSDLVGGVRGSGSGSASGTSRSLLERIRAGDEAAWDRLVRLYAPLILSWCRLRGLREPDDADVFQEVFRAVVANFAGFRREKEGDTFRGWIRTITENKVRDHFRKLASEPPGAGGTDAQRRLGQHPAPPEGPGPDADETAGSDVTRLALDLIRSEFAERTWMAFWGTAVDGRSADDVAADLAMSPGAVRVAKSRVLARLREEFGELIE